MRVRWLRGGLVLAGVAVVLAVGAVVLWPRPDRITQENFDRLREGMSRGEVEAILGPPGDYTTGPTARFGESVYLNGSPFDWDTINSVRVWSGDAALVTVKVDEQRKVVNAMCTFMHRVPQGPLDGLLWRAKRQYWRWFNPTPRS
jgi:hypothetical protein